MNSGVGSFMFHKNQVSESAVKQELQFLSLSEKTRKSNYLQIVFAKAAISPQLFKDSECFSGRGLNPWPPAQ